MFQVGLSCHLQLICQEQTELLAVPDSNNQQ